MKRWIGVRGEESLLNVGKKKDDKAGNKAGNKEKKPVTAKKVNKAITTAIAGLVGTDLPKLVTDQLAPLKTALEEIQSMVKNSKTDGNDDKNKSGDDKNKNDVKNLPPEVNATIHELRNGLAAANQRIKEMTDNTTKAQEQAKKEQRKSAILEVLSPFKFENETAAAAAYRLVDMETKEQDGVYVAGDNLPLKTFVTELIPTKLSGLLASEDVGGAGSGRSSFRPSTQVGMETIRKGMTSEERQAVVTEIEKAVAAGQLQQ